MHSCSVPWVVFYPLLHHTSLLQIDQLKCFCSSFSGTNMIIESSNHYNSATMHRAQSSNFTTVIVRLDTYNKASITWDERQDETKENQKRKFYSLVLYVMHHRKRATPHCMCFCYENITSFTLYTLWVALLHTDEREGTMCNFKRAKNEPSEKCTDLS